MTEPDLVRFVTAQDPIYTQVIKELTNGSKRIHWMWFIAIRDLDQAKRYLADPIPGARLRQTVRLMMSHKRKSAL